MEGLDGDFFEKDDVVVAVVLQANVAFVGAQAVLRLEIEFARGNRLAFGVIGDLDVKGAEQVVSTIKKSGG